MQSLLCHASLGTGIGTVAAFEAARAHCSIANLDHGSARLLPLVFRNLASVGWEGPELSLLRGVHRHAWSRNQRHLAALSELINAPSMTSTVPLLLKGVPAAVLHYPDIGSRPFSDVDILVRPHEVRHVTSRLRQLGYESAANASFDVGSTASYHAVGFTRESDGAQCDVHWRASYEEHSADVSERFARATSFAIPGQPGEALRLDATDSFLLTIVHGMRWNVVAPIRWIVDASLLLRLEKKDLDWERLIIDAERYCVLSSLKEGLRFLHAKGFSPHVPGAVLTSLIGHQPKAMDRVSHAVRIARPSYPQLALRLLFADYAQRTAGVEIGRRVLAYPPYLASTLRRTTTFRTMRNR